MHERTLHHDASFSVTRKEPLSEGEQLLLFAGQGTQRVGMGEQIYKDSEAAKEVYLISEEVSKMPVRDISFSGPEDLLNENIQRASITRQIAALEAGIEVYGQKFRNNFGAILGHSAAEITAAYASGALSVRDALFLADRREEAFKEAQEKSPGRMIALTVRSAELRDKLLHRIDDFKSSGFHLAVENSPTQVVMSAPKHIAEGIMDRIKSLGDKDIKTSLLRIFVGAHSPLMEPAAEEFNKALDEVDFQDPRVPMIGNALGEVLTSAAKIKEELKNHILMPVQFAQNLQTSVHMGIANRIELGAEQLKEAILLNQMKSDGEIDIEHPIKVNRATIGYVWRMNSLV